MRHIREWFSRGDTRARPLELESVEVHILEMLAVLEGRTPRVMLFRLFFILVVFERGLGILCIGLQSTHCFLIRFQIQFPANKNGSSYSTSPTTLKNQVAFISQPNDFYFNEVGHRYFSKA